MVLKYVLPFFILVLAGGIAYSLVKTAPVPERKPKAKLARLVETIEVVLGTYSVPIEAWGDVRPARQITLRSQVGGAIIEVSPELVPSGRFAKGDIILRVDPSDYALAVRQRRTDLEKARADLLLEQGNQVVAKQEFDLLGEGISEREKALVLRLPQLQSSQANVEAAKAALESAKLSLARTVLRAPFDSTVLQRHVDLGMYITTSTDIVTLVGTDEYWVEVSVAPSQLRWIKLPQTEDDPASAVKLYQDTVWGKTTFREGRVIRLLTDLESEGRMARVLVSIKDPLNVHATGPQGPKVLLGTYLRAEIQGRDLEQVAKVDRHLIHDQDTVWLLKDDNTLEIRDVNILYRGPEDVLVAQSLREGERLIVNDIPSPTEGMALRTRSSDSPQEPQSPHGN